jgi:hypothetical protein
MAPHTGGGQARLALAATASAILSAISGGNRAVFRSIAFMNALMHSKIDASLPLVSFTMNMR